VESTPLKFGNAFIGNIVATAISSLLSGNGMFDDDLHFYVVKAYPNREQSGQEEPSVRLRILLQLSHPRVYSLEYLKYLSSLDISTCCIMLHLINTSPVSGY
jgi:hypothetical protein